MKLASVQIEDGPQMKCLCPEGVAIHMADKCIVDVDHILEYGRVLAFEEHEDDERKCAKMPTIVRQATLQDQSKARENAVMRRMAAETCERKAEKYELQMRFVRVRYNFDRSVLRILYTADQHLDTREMIKELAAELRARIDMNQIGVRDEASIIGGLGPCGRELCCCTWLKEFESVNVKMAKAQRLSLNPSAISGNCGRLKCCLRYEYDLYRELSRHLPRQGSSVMCREGKGCVIGRDILRQRLRVGLEDQRVVDCDAADVEILWANRDRNRRSRDENSGA